MSFRRPLILISLLVSSPSQATVDFASECSACEVARISCPPAPGPISSAIDRLAIRPGHLVDALGMMALVNAIRAGTIPSVALSGDADAPFMPIVVTPPIPTGPISPPAPPSGPLGPISPDGPQCEVHCVGTGLCGPPTGDLCSGDSHKPVLPAECDPRVCDPLGDPTAISLVDLYGKGDPPFLPADCKLARPGDDLSSVCGGTLLDPFEFLERVTERFAGSEWSDFCQSAMHGGMSCLNDKVCNGGADGTRCIQCDARGDCWREFTAAGDADPNVDYHPNDLNRNCPDGSPTEHNTCPDTGESPDATGTPPAQKPTFDNPLPQEPAKPPGGADPIQDLHWGDNWPDPPPPPPDPITPDPAPKRPPPPPPMPGPRAVTVKTTNTQLGAAGVCQVSSCDPPPHPGYPDRQRAINTHWHGGKAQAGDPVDVGSGQLTQSAVDLEIPARQGGLHFRFERRYSSGGITQGVLGRNWTHSYEEKLVPVTELTNYGELPSWCMQALPTVHCVAHHSGPDAVEIFAQDPQTLVFLPPPGSYSSLRRRTAKEGHPSYWVMRDADGLLTAFTSDGRLLSKRDRDGATMNFYYGPLDDGPLQEVIDPFQRVIRFAYQNARLTSVTDFAGRSVKFDYAALDSEIGLDANLARLFGIPAGQWLPGYLQHQAKLIQVKQIAAGRTATWNYTYLTLAQATQYPLPSVTPLDPLSPDVCAQGSGVIRDLAYYRQIVDELLGKITDVRDPRGNLVLHTEYQPNWHLPDFGRVLSQTYGGVATPAHYEYPTEITDVPWQVLAGMTGSPSIPLLLADRPCDELAARHAGRPVQPSPLDVFGVVGLGRTWKLIFDQTAALVKVILQEPTPDIGVSLPDLALDVAKICQWTHFTDRIGRESYYGTNFLGHAILEGHRDDSGGWALTLRHDTPFGQVAAELGPDGRLVQRTFDEGSANPLSRGNLLSTTESVGTASRSWLFTYEPLFNRVMTAVDPLGAVTQYSYDYFESSPALGPAIAALLARWGSTAATLDGLAPSLVLAGADLNYDGRTDRMSGDRIVVREPTATLADGMQQPLQTTLTYDEFGQLASVEAGGRVALFNYFPTKYPDGSSTPPETSATYLAQLSPLEQSARGVTGGYLAWIKQPLDQSAAHPGFDSVGVDMLGRFFSYDRTGAISGESDGRGHAKSYQRDGFGLIKIATDEMGHTRTMSYDADLDLIGLDEDIGGWQVRHTSFFRDVEGKLVGRCGELQPGACSGSLASLAASRSGNSGAALTTWDYDGEGRVLQITDPESHLTTVTWDWRDLPTHIVRGADGAPESSTQIYDTGGRPIQILDGVGDATVFAYDGFGRMIREQRPNGTLVTRGYDLRDHMLSERVTGNDGRGTVRDLSELQLVLDERGRVREQRRRWITDAIAPSQVDYTEWLIERYQLDALGQPTRITAPDGAVRTLGYDSLGQVIADEDSRGPRVYHISLPGYSMAYQRQIADGKDIYTIDGLQADGRVIWNYQFASTGGDFRLIGEYGYNGLGQLVTRINGLGQVDNRSVDLLGRLRSVTLPSDEAGTTTRVTTYGYDRRGFLTSTLDPGGVTTHRQYNEAGRLSAEYTPAFGTSWVRDGAGRPTSEVRSSGDSLNFSYTGGFVSRIDGYKNGALAGARRLDRDGLGRIVAGGQDWGGHHVESAFGYDSLGRTLFDTTGVDGWVPRRTSYHFDKTGLRALDYPMGITLDIQHDALGRSTTLDLRGEAVATLGWVGSHIANVHLKTADTIYDVNNRFDGLGRPIGTDVVGRGGARFSEQQVLDPLDRVRVVTQELDGVSRTRANKYTGSGWLDELAEAPIHAALPAAVSRNSDVDSFVTASLPSAAHVSFLRDAVGTLTQEVAPTEPFSASVNAATHAYGSVTVGGVPLALHFDGSGRVTGTGKDSYTWDAFDHLVSVTHDGHVTDYAYDVLDRRAGRFANGHSDTFGFQGWNALLDDRDGDLRTGTIYAPGVDHPLRIESLAKPNVNLVQDLHGDVVALLDDQGVTVEKYQYDAYGNRAVTYADGTQCDERDGSGALCASHYENPFGYTGQLRDDETGLYFYKHRYYSPVLRQFLSPDPLGDIDSANPWVYAAGDPVSNTDPFGLSVKPVGITPKVSRPEPEESTPYEMERPEIEFPAREREFSTNREGFLTGKLTEEKSYPLLGWKVDLVKPASRRLRVGSPDSARVDVKVGVSGPGIYAGVDLDHHGNFTAKTGFRFVAVNGSLSPCIGAVCVNVGAEIGIKVEFGFTIGAETIEVKLPLVTLRLDITGLSRVPGAVASLYSAHVDEEGVREDHYVRDTIESDMNVYLNERNSSDISEFCSSCTQSNVGSSFGAPNMSVITSP